MGRVKCETEMRHAKCETEVGRAKCKTEVERAKCETRVERGECEPGTGRTEREPRVGSMEGDPVMLHSGRSARRVTLGGGCGTHGEMERNTVTQVKCKEQATHSDGGNIGLGIAGRHTRTITMAASVRQKCGDNISTTDTAT